MSKFSLFLASLLPFLGGLLFSFVLGIEQLSLVAYVIPLLVLVYWLYLGYKSAARDDRLNLVFAVLITHTLPLVATLITIGVISLNSQLNSIAMMFITAFVSCAANVVGPLVHTVMPNAFENISGSVFTYVSALALMVLLFMLGYGIKKLRDKSKKFR